MSSLSAKKIKLERNLNVMKLDKIISKTEKLESLLFVLQDSAETGNMPAEVYADAFEIIRDMLGDLRHDLRGMEAAA